MNWFKRKEEKPQEVVHKTVVGSWNGMTAEDWFADHTNIRYMQRLLADGKFRDVLAVMENQAPWHLILPIDKYTGNHAAFSRGYAYCLEYLLSLAKEPDKEPAEVDVDYGLADRLNEPENTI